MKTQDSQTVYVLEGFLRCRECEAILHVHTLGDAHDPVYQCTACNGQHRTPSMPAGDLERWIIQEVTCTVMTDSNTKTLTEMLAAGGGSLSEDAPEMLRDPANHPDRVRAIATDPAIYAIQENIPQTKQFLSKLINRITLSEREVVVHYALPLPQDSTLPGSYRQHLRLPDDVLN